MNDSLEKVISTYLRYRYLPGNISPLPKKKVFSLERKKKTIISDEKDLDAFLKHFISQVDFKKTGILLSGGIDSVLLASYCPKGTIAFTLKYPEMPSIDECDQAKKYADLFGLTLIEVPVTWQDVLLYQDDLMLNKQSPLTAIEVGIYKMCLTSLDYGLENLLTGMGADVVFFVFFKIMSKKWENDEFVNFYTKIIPSSVIKNPSDTLEFFNKYYEENFDTDSFLAGVFSNDTISSFLNAFSLAGVNILAPYEFIERGFNLDTHSIIEGEEKKLLHNLFLHKTGQEHKKRKYPLPRPLLMWKEYFELTQLDFWKMDPLATVDTDEKRWMIYSADRFIMMFRNKCFNHYKIGYTTGVYDMFHVGHLNLLKRAAQNCDKLIVGVTSDELVHYKNKDSVIPFSDRISIIRALPFVYKAVKQENMNKKDACLRYCANVIFVGDDWKGTDKWNKYEQDLKEIGVDVVYFPYTKKVSSTSIRQGIKNEK